MNSRERGVPFVLDFSVITPADRINDGLVELGRYLLQALAFACFLLATAFGQSAASPDCQMVAYLPPMATFGGPAIAATGDTEVGLGFGGYGEILPSPCIHAGAEDGLARWRRGVADKIDLGFDFLTENRTDQSLGGTGKVALRYLLTPGLRVEAGLGAADGGDGRNFNADSAVELGTHNANKSWNYYMSLRVAGARGCIGCGATNTNHAPGALVPLGAIGTTARVSDSAKFVMEAGTGEVFARQYSSPAGYFHLFFGVLFGVGSGKR